MRAAEGRVRPAPEHASQHSATLHPRSEPLCLARPATRCDAEAPSAAPMYPGTCAVRRARSPVSSVRGPARNYASSIQPHRACQSRVPRQTQSSTHAQPQESAPPAPTVCAHRQRLHASQAGTPSRPQASHHRPRPAQTAAAARTKFQNKRAADRRRKELPVAPCITITHRDRLPNPQALAGGTATSASTTAAQHRRSEPLTDLPAAKSPRRISSAAQRSSPLRPAQRAALRRIRRLKQQVHHTAAAKPKGHLRGVVEQSRVALHARAIPRHPGSLTDYLRLQGSRR